MMDTTGHDLLNCSIAHRSGMDCALQNHARAVFLCDEICFLVTAEWHLNYGPANAAELVGAKFCTMAPLPEDRFFMPVMLYQDHVLSLEIVDVLYDDGIKNVAELSDLQLVSHQAMHVQS